MTRVVLVTGAGGVGKTTLAGAIAVGAAGLGQRALVVTVDPARRLAQALGLATLSTEPAPVLGYPNLEAAMLDPAASWDALAQRHADPATADRLIAHRFFRAIAERFPAGQAYAAAEETARISDQRGHDVVVVDTPPAGGAADFFSAPARIRTLLAGRALRVLTGPSLPGRRVLYSVTARPALRLADRVLGGSLLEDVAEFLLDLRPIYDGVRSRATEVDALFADAHTVVATTADPEPLEQAHLLLENAPGRARTVLVNRTVPAAWIGRGNPSGDPHARNLARWGGVAARQQLVLSDLQRTATPPVAIPWITPSPASITALATLIPPPALEQILS